MRAREPDGAGAWWSEGRRCGLGHRRLSIIDLSDRAAQPMLGSDGRLTIVFNGETYNFPQIKAELETEGAHLRIARELELRGHKTCWPIPPSRRYWGFA
jgi:asparagine synthase (glutamine-hydrolysing)